MKPQPAHGASSWRFPANHSKQTMLHQAVSDECQINRSCNNGTASAGPKNLEKDRGLYSPCKGSFQRLLRFGRFPQPVEPLLNADLAMQEAR
jgi:hypothetical protein